MTLIQDRLDELGMSQAQLGMKAFGKADNSAIQSLKKGSSPAIDRLEAMAAALGWVVYFGPPKADARPINELHEPESSFDRQKADAFRSGFLPLPWAETPTSTAPPPVAFSYAWLHSNGLIPDNLACLVPDEVNILGFFLSKPLAIVDQAEPKQGFGIWAIKEVRTNLVRAMFEEDLMIIQGREATIPPRIISDWKHSQIEVLGKVVWIGAHP